MLGPHIHINCTRDTPAAETRQPAPEDGRQRGGQRLTPDAPCNGGRPPPPGTAPHHPRGTQLPAEHASQVDSAGPPHPHTSSHSTWVAGPDSPPTGRAAGGGEAPEPRRPSQRRKAPPPGTPLRQPQSTQQRLARAHAVGPVLGPHAHTNRTRETRVAEPRRPAPKGAQPGQGQRLTPDAPHNGDRPPPPGTALHHPRGTQPLTGHANQADSAGPPHPHTRTHSTWLADPDSPPRGRAAGGGGAPELRRPSQRRKTPPPGMSFRHPHSAQQQLTRAHAVVPVLGPHAHTNCTRETRAAEPRQPAPKDGRPGGRQRLTSDAPRNGGGSPPPETVPHHPRGTQVPAEHASQGDSAVPPHPHTRAHSTWVANPDSPPRGRAAGG